MQWIISSSLRLRTLVVGIVAALLIGGAWQLRNTPLDIVPEFSPLTLEVKTESLGLSSAEVEALITIPLEADLLNGVAWLESIESESTAGLSTIEMTFAPGTDLMHARQMVQERLTQAHANPNVSTPPVLLQPVSSAGRIMNIGLTSKTVSLIEMSVQARWIIVPRLLGVPGVANVSIWGQRQWQLQVQVDPKKLHSNGINLDQVVKTAGEAVWVSPLTFLNSSTPGSGGFIDTPNQRLNVRHQSPIITPKDFGKVPVFGTSLPLSEVAEVMEGHQPLIGDAILKDGPGLLLVVEKFPGFNTQEVTGGVERALAELQPGMTGMDVDTSIYRAASFIERATNNLATRVWTACAILILALGILLGSWRAALIGVVVAPLSLLAAIFVLHLGNVNINMMVVAGLLLAIGAIVHDAILDVENIRRRLQQARSEGGNRSAANIIIGAALEVRGPMLYATLIIILAVVPVLLVQGRSAAFFQPLIWSYVLAVLASMLIALVVTPALAMLLLSKAASNDSGGSPLVRGLQRLYDRADGLAMRSPIPVYVLAAISALAILLVWSRLERSMLPTFKETDVVVDWQAPSGTSLPAMTKVTSALMHDLRAIPGVRNAAAHIGRAMLCNCDEAANVNSAQVWVSIDPGVDYDDTLEAMQEVVDSFPGMNGRVQTYLSKKLREALTGRDNTLTVRVYGQDLNIIRRKAEEIRVLLSKIEGIEDPQVELHSEEAAIEIEVDVEKANKHGLKPGDVRRATSSLLSGITVGGLFQDQKVFDVVVWATPENRNNFSNVANLLLDTEAGSQVRLSDVAAVRTAPATSVIQRQGVSRYIDVEAEVSGRSVGDVARDATRQIKNLAFPFEYHAQVLGEHVERRAALRSIYGYFVAAAIIGFLLLQAALRSWRLAALSIIGVPLVLLGGLLAVYIDEGVFSLGSLLGFVIVMGLATRIGIMLVRHFQYLEQCEGEPFGEGLVRRGVREQFTSIVATSIIIGLLVLPFVVLGDVAGLEIVYPAAVVVLGGLVTSILVPLIAVPALYLRFGANTAADTLGIESETA
jgi:Cu/Ag efflux pump CusA